MANQQNQGQNSRGDDQYISDPVEVGLPWKLMLFTFILLLLSIFIFLGLKFGYITYLDNEIEATDQQMAELASQVSEEERESFATFYSQFINLRDVLNQRKFSQNSFALLENQTLSNIYYLNTNYNSERQNMTLSGRAASMEDFVNQMKVFDDTSQVENSIIEELGRDESGISFVVNLSLSEEFLNQPNQ